MHDRPTQAAKSAAVATSLVAIVLVVSDFFAPHETVGSLGILFALASAVLWVRSFYVDMSRRLRDAFDLGRAAGRQEAGEDELTRGRSVRAVR